MLIKSVMMLSIMLGLVLNGVLLAPASETLTNAVDEKSTYIDQRQTGDLNVHVNLKDVQIIAIVKGGTEEYTDYDYNYDYSEMTIKPQKVNGTTSTTTSTLSLNITSTEIPEVSSSITPTVPPFIEITPKAVFNGTNDTLIDINCDKNDTVKDDIMVSSENVTHAAIKMSVDEKLNGTVVSTSIPLSTIDSKACQKGYVKNKYGECEYRPKNNAINTLKKLVELSQKLKLRRGEP